jgi:rhomboid protease GluP
VKLSANAIKLCLIVPSVLVLIGVALLVDPKTALRLTPTALLQFGANFAPYTLALNQYWRVITAGFVHHGPIHFGLNMWALFMLTPMLYGLVGGGRCLFVFLLSVIGGSLFSILWDPTIISFGASGGIFGMLGCYATCSYLKTKFGASNSKQVSGLWMLAVVIYCVLLGMITPGTDNANHLGGLLTGSLLGIWCGAATLERIKCQQLSKVSLACCIVLLVCLFGIEKFTMGSNSRLQSLAEEQEAIELESKHDYAHALRVLNQAIARSPEEMSLYASRITILIELKQFREALADCDHVLSQKSDDRAALLCKSIAHHNLGEDSTAVDDLKSLIKLDPSKPLLYNNIAWSLIAMGKYDQARAYIDNAIAIDPNLATAHDTKGVLLTCTGKLHEALAEIDRAITLNKRDGAAYYHRSIVLSKLGDSQAAENKNKAQALGYKPEPWETQQ